MFGVKARPDVSFLRLVLASCASDDKHLQLQVLQKIERYILTPSVTATEPAHCMRLSQICLALFSHAHTNSNRCTATVWCCCWQNGFENPCGNLAVRHCWSMKLKYLQPNTSKALIDRQKASILQKRAAVLKHARLDKPARHTQAPGLNS